MNYTFILAKTQLVTDTGETVIYIPDDNLGGIIGITPQFPQASPGEAIIKLRSFGSQNRFVQDYAPIQFINNTTDKQTVNQVYFTYDPSQPLTEAEVYQKTIEALAAAFGKQTTDFEVTTVAKP